MTRGGRGQAGLRPGGACAGGLLYPAGRIDQTGEAPDGERIALRPQTGDDAVRPQRHVGMVPKRLALVHVRDVHLDHRRLEGVERVEDGDGGVREGGRVDDDAAGRFARFVDPVDDLVFAVALMEADVEPVLAGYAPAFRLHVGQGLVAVDCGLALAEQVQVRTVQDVDQAAHGILTWAGKSPSGRQAGPARPSPPLSFQGSPLGRSGMTAAAQP